MRAGGSVCGCAQTSAPACTCLRLHAPICTRPHPSARTLCQRRSRFDTSASLKLPTVKKKIGKIFLYIDVCQKRMDGQVCPSVRVLNRCPNLHVRLVRQPCPIDHPAQQGEEYAWRRDNNNREGFCRSTKTQVVPSSALNRAKYHQSNPSNVPGILYSSLPKRSCIYASKFLITRSNRIPSL